MKRIVFILLVFSFVTFTKAQTSGEYDLSEYALPDMELQTLDFKFGLGGNGDGRVYNPDFETDNNNSYDQSHGLSLQSDYSLYRNNRKQQLRLEAGFSLDGGFNKQFENEKLIYKGRYFRPELDLRLNSRFYLNNKFFYGADPKIQTSFSTQKHKSRNDNDIWKEQSGFKTYADILLPLKIGVGRTESVTDARQAIFILEALKDNGHLDRTATREEITAFAELISETRNLRFFDNRIQQMKELEVLDSYLKEKGFVEGNNISYFTTLMDYWNYGRPVPMYAGNRISLVVAPGYRISKSVSDKSGEPIDNKRQSIYKSLQAGIEFWHSKPYGLHWHHSLNFSAFAGWLKYDSRDENNPNVFERKASSPNLQFRHRNNLNYYMNTRSTFTLGYDISYTHFIDDSQPDNDVLSNAGDAVSGNIRLDAYYYISPKLRLSFYSRLDYLYFDNQLEDSDTWAYGRHNVYSFYHITDQRYGSIEIQKRIHFNYNLSLRYSLF